MSRRARAKAAGLVRIMRGCKYDVVLIAAVKKEYDRLKKKHLKDFARSHRAMKNLAQFGLSQLPPEHFAWEGRFPSGVSSKAPIHIGVIKGYQARFYGGMGRVDDRPAFIVVKFARKKRDSANQELLRSAAHQLAAYV